MRKWTRRLIAGATLLLAVLTACGTGCQRHQGGAPDAIKEEPANAAAERAKFQGDWKHLSFNLNGEPAAAHVVAGFVFRFENTRYSITNKGKVTSQGTFTLDPTASPAAIDFTESGGVAIHGVYRFEGDRLTICMREKQRPTDFESRPGQQRNLIVLERKSK
jgi:uncharacterized protein (TIGR03067 family)